LIRSNRPLYRACPKHTKLLVSKAIVQAVQQQGGRFLERSRKDGFWYVVPYKRAVDKTSQGLRERDRDDDDDGGGGGGSASGQSSSTPAATVTVPYQFSGQRAQKLSDLADVAIARANQMDGLPRSASGLMASTGMTAAADSNTATKHPPQRSPTIVPRMAKTAPPPPPPPQQQQQQQQPQQQPQRKKPQQRSLPISQPVTRVDVKRPPPPTAAQPPPPPPQQQQQQQQRMESKDAASLQPLPPSLEPRQSSMFRLLRDTKLLPMESAYGGSLLHSSAYNQHYPYPPTTAAMAQQQQQQQQQQRMPTQQGATGPAVNSASVYGNGYGSRGDGRDHDVARAAALYELANGLGVPPYGGPYAATAAAVAAAQQQQQQQSRVPAHAWDKNPPALTRLTTQVSDWLNSFWPVPAPTATAAAPGASPAATAPSRVPARTAPPIVMISPPEPHGSIQINTIPPMEHANRKNEEEQNKEDDVEVQSRPAPSQDSTESRTDTSPPPLGDAKPTVMFQESSTFRSTPTELEQSVSATLLKLASTPSRFFSGISMLFGEDDDDTATDKTATTTTLKSGPQVAGSADGPPILAGTKRSKASLLDDDSDDEDEDDGNNKYSTTTKKPRSSFVNDYEDSSMKAKFRTTYYNK